MSKRPSAPSKRAETRGWFASLEPRWQSAVCITFLYLVCLVMFRAIVFDGKAFQAGGDTAAAQSYAHAGTMLEEKEGVDVLWMPFFFSGMPTFGNVAYIPHDVSYLQHVGLKLLDLLFLNRQWTWLVVFYFLSGVFMFFLARELGHAHLIALFAAFAYMLSPYAVGLAGEGHGSKLMAVAYLPAVFLLTHLAFRRRTLLSMGLLAIAIGTLMLTRHVQIVYYGLALVGSYLIFTVVNDLRERQMRAGTVKVVLVLGAMVLALAISAYIYLSIYEYSQYSIRGGGTTGAGGALSWDYATNWSWHPLELLTLLIPGFFGFQLPYYWGAMQPWTNSSVYIGVAPILLAVFAVFYRRTRLIWFLLGTTIVVILLSFGRNLAFFYDIFFTILPFFNKFRAPAMILHLLAFTVPLLGATGLAALLELRERKGTDMRQLRKVLVGGLAVAGAAALLILLFRSALGDLLGSFLFTRSGEWEQMQGQYGARAQQMMRQLTAARYDIFWRDALIFFVIAGASIGVVVAYLDRKLRPTTTAGLLVAILVIDLGLVDSRLIKPEPSSALDQAFQPDATVRYLKEQSGLYRIFPLGNLFGDNTYAYHGLQSIGGYSPAKIKIYQTMLDSAMYRGSDPRLPLNMAVVNMLGVRYLLAPGLLPPGMFEETFRDPARGIVVYRNAEALPRAFLVDTAVVAVSDADVFRRMNAPTFDPARVAILQQELPMVVGRPDSTSHVEVSAYASRSITVEVEVAQPALLVLSEVYYPPGWTATVDGSETPIYRTNSVLRSVIVPAGRHSVNFAYDPALYHIGYFITIGAWSVAGMLVAIPLLIAWTGRKRSAGASQPG